MTARSGERQTRGVGTIAWGPYGTTPDGHRVTAFSLTNDRGVRVRFIEYGGIVLSIRTPDRRGTLADITLGYDTLEEYVRDTRYLGVMVGRYANRIANGRFSLEGQRYALATNDGPHHLHGGTQGLGRAVWRGEAVDSDAGLAVDLTYTSPDGEDNYPGRLAVRARCTLTSDNELMFDFHAVTDRPTPVNLSQHCYFNLAGTGGTSDVLGHELEINASRFTPVDATLIPTGEQKDVTGTPFDFRRPVVIGARIRDKDDQLVAGGGYDHNYVLDGAGLRRAALVHEPASGRKLEVLTTQPGLQFYSGNSLQRREPGEPGTFVRHGGFCLEAQKFPDAPNRPGFPTTILQPGVEYREKIVYRFGVRS